MSRTSFGVVSHGLRRKRTTRLRFLSVSKRKRAAVKSTSKRLPHQVIISPLHGLQGENMSEKISRRKFVRSAAAIAAFSSLPVAETFGSLVQNTPSARTEVPLTNDPDWKNQGIENLAKSAHAKLRNIPVRAVTIQSGFWGARRARDEGTGELVPA